MTGSVLEQNRAVEGGEVPISDLNTNTMAAAPRVLGGRTGESRTAGYNVRITMMSIVAVVI